MQNKTDANAYLLSKAEFLTKIDDQYVPISTFIRKPFESQDDHWICAAGITGLFHRKADLAGDSPAQAIANAQQFLRSELNGFITQGGQLNTVKRQPLTGVNHLFDTV